MLEFELVWRIAKGCDEQYEKKLQVAGNNLH
jgi:hypothetical protein